MSSCEDNKDDSYRKELEDWSSDGEYQGSEDNNYWRSDVDWNGGSSMAGEASGVSEATEEEQPEEEEDEDRKKKPKQKKNDRKKATPKKKFNVDDVGTDDESRHYDDTTERSDLLKSTVSQMNDISDIEDQISEAHSKFAEDKQSLSSVMGLVDEVTVKGENLARKASETSLALDKGKFDKGALMEDKLKLLETDDDNSYDADVLQVYGSRRKGRKISAEKDTSGKIEYIDSDKDNFDEHLSQGSNLSKTLNASADGESDRRELRRVGPKSRKPSAGGKGSYEFDGTYLEKDAGTTQNEDASCRSWSEGPPNKGGLCSSRSRSCSEGPSSKGGSCSNRSRSCSEVSSRKGGSCKDHLKNALSDDGNTVLSAEPSIMKLDTDSNLSQTDRISKDECFDDRSLRDEVRNRSEKSLEEEGSERSSRASPEFDEPECCENEGHKHVCCFINIGGGGDGGSRESEIINRLKKLRDDIANMREELSHARKECKKESDEVAKLIEETIARNKAAEQHEVQEVVIQSSTLSTPPKTPPAPAFGSYILEEMRPQVGYQLPTVTRAQVPIPTAVLEDRLRATRRTASTSYRESLQQLEMMVEKEMASIQDSMTRLEPLNKMAAEWDHLQQVRSRSMTFMRDYRMEMITKEMRLQDDRNLQKQSIEIN